MPRFQKGHTGNPEGCPRGAKDWVPCGTLRAAVRAVAQESPDLIRSALERGLKSRQAAGYLTLIQKIEGDRLNLTATLPQPLQVIHEHHED